MVCFRLSQFVDMKYRMDDGVSFGYRLIGGCLLSAAKAAFIFNERLEIFILD
jgi:hypothetical protein